MNDNYSSIKSELGKKSTFLFTCLITKCLALQHSRALCTTGNLPQHKRKSTTIFQGGITGLGESSTDGMIFSVHGFDLSFAVTSLLCCRGARSGGVAAGLGSSPGPAPLAAHLPGASPGHEEPTLQKTSVPSPFGGPGRACLQLNTF